MMRDLPPSAAWEHRDARRGFEVVLVSPEGSGLRLLGNTAAVEDGQAWVVGYDIHVDEHWLTSAAHVWAIAPDGARDVRLETDGSGAWQVNGGAAAHLDGCLDVDLASSACTNTLPVHRLRLEVASAAEAPAAYVRAPHLGVERLEQKYLRVGDDGSKRRYDYEAPAFDLSCRLVFDESGLGTDYPGIARRVL
jgi:hypothetical protein